MFINLQKYKKFRNYIFLTQTQKFLVANRLTEIAQQCFLLQGRPRQRKGSAIPHFEEGYLKDKAPIHISYTSYYY